MVISPFHKVRASYQPRFPERLGRLAGLGISEAKDAALGGGGAATPSHQQDELRRRFPKTWGQAVLELGDGTGPGAIKLEARPFTAAVVLSGGPAPGGHNVVWGIVEGLTSLAKDCKLVGFRGGPSGILDDRHVILTAAGVADYRNTGGFDLLGTGRTKIESPAQFAKCREVLERHHIDALIVIGGDDSNTNAACLAEYLLAQGSPVRVIGVPKTIDGDLKNRFVETSFGFDSAVRLYTDIISNLCRDTLSSRKYYHFIRLMGRSASHITLEAALQTQPNMALVSEEVAAKKQTLRDVVESLGNLVKARAETGRNYGVILIPEGVIEFIPEVKALIKEVNHILADHREYVGSLSGFTAQSEFVHRKLSRDGSYVFSSMPIDIQRQLLMDRDPHGNVQVSRIETEKLLIELLEAYLREEKAEGRYKGAFGYQHHFLGYEGRCANPTNFDADYAYSLGRTAVALVAAGVTGYMAVVSNLGAPRASWHSLGVPLVSMMGLELRHGKEAAVIAKALVDLDGKPFAYFAAHRDEWASGDYYRCTGPVQYFGPPELTDKVPLSLALEQGVEASTPW